MNEKKVTEFGIWLRSKDRAENTITRYTAEIRGIPDDYQDQIDYIMNHHQKRHLIFAWRAFLKFLYHQDEISREEKLKQLDSIKPPSNKKVEKQKKTIYPRNQWETLVRKGSTPQIRMAIWLGLQFGLRAGETAHLRIQDINSGEGYIQIRSRREDANGQRTWHPKYETDRKISLNQDQARWIAKWLTIRPENLEHRYLIWLPSNGNPVRAKIISRWCTQSGLKSHDLRRSFAWDLYIRSNHNIKVVSLSLGHKNIAVTSDYLGIGEEDYLELARKATMKLS